MSKLWVGIVPTSDTITIVHASVPDSGAITIVADHTWTLQKGSKASAYELIHQRVSDYVGDHKIDVAVIKGSATSRAGAGLAHFHAAEVRGVVLCAVAKVASVRTDTKARISKNYGERKADEYMKDGDFWDDETLGDLRIGSREAALLILANRKKK